MLPGVVIKGLRKTPDERGYFGEILRSDWQELLGEDTIVQSNLSISHPGIIRAWHCHKRGQVDYFVVLSGALKICAYDEASGEIDEIISAGETLQVVRIPGKYWHGIMVVGNNAATVLYFVNRLYDRNNPDELRRPWNDRTIVPKSINGRNDDPRTGKAWDWNAPPHK